MLPKVGDIEEGVVVRVYPRYAILLFRDGWTGLLHISEVSTSFVRNFPGLIHTGSVYDVKVIEVDEEKSNIRVSLKAITPADKKTSHYRKRKIDPSQVDAKALQEHLNEWVKEELNKGDNK